jgi:hypothetical protein
VLPFSVVTLGAELTNPNLWYPTILGVLVVVAGVTLFVGSIYLILGTNMGARLGFLVTFTALMGFMVVLTSLWITTASPLNTLKGSVPAWQVQQVVPSLDKANVAEVRNIKQTGHKVDAIEQANVKAAVDAALVTKVDTAIQKFTPEDNKYALYEDVTKYLVTSTFEVGGSKPSWLDFQFRHTPRYAVVKFCGAAANTQPFGVAPDTPSCAAPGAIDPATGNDLSAHNGYVILEFNLGDVKFPPIVAFASAALLFSLGLLMLHWYEKDRKALAARAAAAAAPTSTTPDRVREPANV